MENTTKYLQDLKTSVKLDRLRDEAFKARIKNDVYGTSPVPDFNRSIEEERADTTFQLQEANKSLLTILKPEIVQSVLNQLSDDDIYFLNSHFDKIKSELQGRKNITADAFIQFFRRFIDYYDATNQTGIAIPLSQESLSKLSNKLIQEWEEWSKNHLNPLDRKLYDINALLQKTANELGVSLQAIKQEAQSFATSEKFNPELQGLEPDMPPPAREDKGVVKAKIAQLKSDFPALFVKDLVMDREEAIKYYTYLADRNYLPIVPVKIARAMVKAINPSDTLVSNRSLVEGKLRTVFQTLAGEGLRITARKSKTIAPRSSVVRKRGKKDEEHAEFGKYLINLDALRNRHRLVVKYPSKVNVMNFRQNQIVSPKFVSLLTDFINTRILDRELYNDLDDKEQNLLTKISRISEINLGISTKFSKYEKELLKRFDLLKGEVIAGNNNPEILRELKSMILRLTHENILTKKQRDALLYDLFIVLN
jgi:hypothetical protein